MLTADSCYRKAVGASQIRSHYGIRNYFNIFVFCQELYLKFVAQFDRRSIISGSPGTKP